MEVVVIWDLFVLRGERTEVTAQFIPGLGVTVQWEFGTADKKKA